MYIDNKVYKQLINSKTPEEFWNNKNLLDITSNPELNKDNVLIRTLSSDEYSKYIKNGTADGSITSNNVNVWHNTSEVRKGYYSIRGSDSSAWHSTNFTRAQCTNVDNNSTTILNIELLSNNSSTIHYPSTYPIFIEYIAIWGGARYAQKAYANSIFSLNSFNMNKNIDVIQHIITSTLRDASNGAINYNLYIRICTGFRPILNFIDNNKSTNIHY